MIPPSSTYYVTPIILNWEGKQRAVLSKVTLIYYYVEKIFEDHLLGYKEMEADTGPEITKEEFIHDLKSLKNKKAPGPDHIPAENLKLIEEEQIYVLVNLFNSIYKSEIIPEEWLLSTCKNLKRKVLRLKGH